MNRIKCRFIGSYMGTAGRCYRWKVVEGQCVVRKLGWIGLDNIVAYTGDFICIPVKVFWTGDSRFAVFDHAS